MKKFLWVVCLVLFPVTIYAQTHLYIEGQIKDSNQKPISGVYVVLQETSQYTVTDDEGFYKINLLPGTYHLLISHLGYAEINREFTIEGDGKKLDFQLEIDDGNTLEDVHLNVKSKLQQVEESSFNVVALNTEKLHNTSLDLSETLDRVSGMRIRRNGGVGSDYSVMLNGFSGKHVKFFIDGVPMEGFNSAFQLNNIPVNLAKRIEIYKGVVPISFGADALGGAVNIVTSDGGKQNFLDASYSYGSFNTHKTFVNTAYTSDSGFTARFSAFQNYSDNNYKVDVDIVDLETHQFTGDIRRVRRFHDRYKNYSLNGKVGFVNTKFADEFLVGFTFADEYDEIQHPAYMKIAFGEKYTTAQTLMPNLSYRKRNIFVEHLDFSLSANYNFGKAKSIDDSYRRYNWLGEYIITDAPGEFNYTQSHFKDHNGSINANLTYELNYQHRFTINNVLNSFWRKRKDLAEPKPEDRFPSETLKDILAFAYQFKPNDQLNLSVFGKNYFNQVKQYADVESGGNYRNLTKTTQDFGYGIAGSYFLMDNLQLKTSYEKAYRLPNGRELFGAGNDFDLGNPDLKSENSDNLNFGVNYAWQIHKDHHLNIDGSFIYRDIHDFIRMVPNPSNGVLKPGNEALVKNRGVDLSLGYGFQNLFAIETNITYQNMRNKLKYRSGKDVVSTIYNDRIPNMPYLYGNTNVSFYFSKVFTQEDQLNFSYDLNYINEFDYSYESYGGRKIPTQWSHDLVLNYSFGRNRYHISLAARNILDEKLYDNYSLQKPGRNFNIKLRYFLNQF